MLLEAFEVKIEPVYLFSKLLHDCHLAQDVGRGGRWARLENHGREADGSWLLAGAPSSFFSGSEDECSGTVSVVVVDENGAAGSAEALSMACFRAMVSFAVVGSGVDPKKAQDFVVCNPVPTHLQGTLQKFLPLMQRGRMVCPVNHDSGTEKEGTN